ncbi:hypothetical protein E0Z10_g7674 [Xylaria hypoxylon]|uniref:Zinc finger CHCC-type domain-containing protein n=1 Tax=Xylaria hypoxylon TaxID=37992 RepID=A0A4Z0YX95_9PEZI|nr:hypothetical protein E0Z10_g7674 [Xylaria hypoxylon]
MISRVSIRSAARFSQQTCAVRRTFAVSARLCEKNTINVKGETTPETKGEEDSLGLTENTERGLSQAPNRTEIWSRSQKPRATAMSGPRFEQTDFDLQPASKAAIELIHREPVRWTHDRVVACDGGGGPAGHPQIFINTDKPEIATCNYCGLPFAQSPERDVAPPVIMWSQKQFTLPPRSRGSYLVTSEVLEALPEIRQYKVGLLNLFVQHTSCALSLNENWDEDVRADMSDALDRIAPEAGSRGEELYRHNAEGSDDMPAHVKSALIGASITIPIKDGKLATGTWQGIWYLEFRAMRHTRRVMATIQGEKA